MIKKHYVLQYLNMTDMYVHVDNKNAGKPYPTNNPNMICYWELEDHARDYLKVFQTRESGFPWVIKEVEFNCKLVYE